MPTHRPAAANVRLNGRPTWPPPPTTTTSRSASPLTAWDCTSVRRRRLARLRADDRDDDLLEATARVVVDDPGGVELAECLVAVAPSLVAGVVARAGSLEDRDDLREVA